MSTNAKIVLIAAIAVLAGLSFFVWRQRSPNIVSVSEGPVAKVFTYEGDNPGSSFPNELLISDRGETVQNYEAVTNDGRYRQSTYAFVSSKSLDELSELYAEKLKELGWEIKSENNQSAIRAISASKLSASVSITISSNASTGKNSVVISYTEPASK